MNDEHDLALIIRSRFPIVLIETHEESRVLALLERVAGLQQQAFFVWSAADGLHRRDNLMAQAAAGAAFRVEKPPYGKGPVAETLQVTSALKHIHGTPINGIYVLADAHPYLEDPVHQRLLKSIAQTYERTARTLVLVGPSVKLPADLQRLSARFELRLPDAQAMRALIEAESKDRVRTGGAQTADDPEAVSLISQHLVGLCVEDARRLVRQCLSDDGRITAADLAHVLKAKQGSLAGENVVQAELAGTRLEDVAGLANLKRWLTQRRAAFIGDAAALGLDPPKGMLLLGVQGGGKSLAAKAVAGAWKLPLLRLDFGSLYDKWLGETERKLREALKFADTMAPCVLWMDEIEKGVASGDGGDSGGESRRVLGTLLTWMAERKSKVFMVATANDIEHLPPELIRKGRFDEIFFVDLPDAATREEIFKLHLTRRKLDATKFDLPKLAEASDGFSGAEIEQAIVSGLYEAHATGRPLNTVHVLTETVRTRPLSVVMAEKISALREWAAGRTVPAN